MEHTPPSWEQLLKGMQKIMVFPASFPLYVTTNTHTPLRGFTYPLAVYYDKPRAYMSLKAAPVHMHGTDRPDPLIMTFRGTIAGQPAIIPSIEGWAKVYGYNTIILDDDDPYVHGFQVI